jgi:hypothetical protein
MDELEKRIQVLESQLEGTRALLVEIQNEQRKIRREQQTKEANSDFVRFARNHF